MIDFTSSLYLGLLHPGSSLEPWSRLTTGRPAALNRSAPEYAVAGGLAALVGCEAAVLGPSTLHLFLDLFHLLAREPIAIFLDRCGYPIAHWGAKCAATRSVAVRYFDHRAPLLLRRRLHDPGARRGRPVIVTDGFCPACSTPAPLSAYLEMVQAAGGWLVIDDTQALGILGRHPGLDGPYGRGGGGSLRWHCLSNPRIIVVNSLAKAFGAPMAMLAGSRQLVRRFGRYSRTRIHCSPPSAANMAAAARALALNARQGDALRRVLARRVGLFKELLATSAASAGMFPVQALRLSESQNPAEIHEELQRRGVHAVLHRHCLKRASQISLVITARHTPAQIAATADAVSALAGATPSNPQHRRFGHAAWMACARQR